MMEFIRVPGRASRGAQMRFREGQTVGHVPEGSKLATVERVRDRVWLTGWGETVEQPAEAEESFQSFLSALPEDRRWALEDVRCEDQGETIAEAIQMRRCVAVSDSSFKLGLGTAAFMI